MKKKVYETFDDLAGGHLTEKEVEKKPKKPKKKTVTNGSDDSRQKAR